MLGPSSEGASRDSSGGAGGPSEGATGAGTGAEAGAGAKAGAGAEAGSGSSKAGAGATSLEGDDSGGISTGDVGWACARDSASSTSSENAAGDRAMGLPESPLFIDLNIIPRQ